MKRLMAVALVALLAGCTKPAGPTGMFADADHRWTGSSDGPFQDTDQVVLPAGPNTLRLAAQADYGFAVHLTSPSGSTFGIVHAYRVDIGRLEFLITDDVAGRWTIDYACESECDYAIAISEGDQVPTTPAPTYQDAATAFVAGSLDGDAESQRFDVPVGDVLLRTHVASEAGIEWSIRDGLGHLVTAWGFDKVNARDWRYGPSDPETDAGEWQVNVQCDAVCTYNFGVIVGRR